jgi:uncharacterized protein YxjI
MIDERFAHDAFFVDQLIRPIANLYRISTLGSDGGPGQPVAFVRQKKLSIREDIRFLADESETEELFRLKARQVFDVRGRYEVTTPEGERIGTLEKVFGISLVRSTWRVYDPNDQQVALAQEKSIHVALFRRLIDFVPYGEFAPIVFQFTIHMDGREVGELRRPLGIRDRYTLTLGGDPERRLDRRVAIALAIALDALQSR